MLMSEGEPPTEQRWLLLIHQVPTRLNSGEDLAAAARQSCSSASRRPCLEWLFSKPLQPSLWEGLSPLGRLLHIHERELVAVLRFVREVEHCPRWQELVRFGKGL